MSVLVEVMDKKVGVKICGRSSNKQVFDVGKIQQVGSSLTAYNPSGKVSGKSNVGAVFSPPSRRFVFRLEVRVG